jgi:bacterial/archaeal transporter family-2 protein
MSRVVGAMLTAATGALVALQAPVNSRLGKAVGTFQATAISFLVGLIVLVAIALLTGGFGSLGRAGRLPWWAFVGGVLGASYVASVLVTVRTLGVGGVTAATITGQLAAAVVIDRFGIAGVSRHPITFPRIAGIALLAAGAFLVVRH